MLCEHGGARQLGVGVAILPLSYPNPATSAYTEMGKNKVALVTLGKGHKISEIMKKKAALREKKPYTRVFIEPHKTIMEQRTEANIRTLAKATKGVEFKRGRVTEGGKNKVGQTEANSDQDQNNGNNRNNPKPGTSGNRQRGTEERNTENE